MYFGAVVLAEKRHLCLVFDALGNDVQLESVSHREQGFRDGGILAVDGDAPSEELVDLQRV